MHDRKLIKRPSSFSGFNTIRTVYAMPEIDAITKEPFAETFEGGRLAQFGSLLDAFSEHDRFSVAENPDRKSQETMLARVRPVNAQFWSMRVTEPSNTPGIRGIGAFIEKNEIAVLHWDFREAMDFEDAVRQAREIWADLFGNAAPHSGATLDEYLTNYWRV